MLSPTISPFTNTILLTFQNYIYVDVWWMQGSVKLKTKLYRRPDCISKENYTRVIELLLSQTRQFSFQQSIRGFDHKIISNYEIFCKCFISVSMLSKYSFFSSPIIYIPYIYFLVIRRPTRSYHRFTPYTLDIFHLNLWSIRLKVQNLRSTVLDFDILFHYDSSIC